MSAQIRVSKIGVPNEKDTGIPRSVVTSAEPAPAVLPKLDFSAPSMSSNNMPKGRQV